MMVKVICVLAAVLAIVSAEHGHSSQSIHRHDSHHTEVKVKDHHGHHHVDYYAHPKYKFEYKVDDKHTGDHKEEYEHRDGHENDSKYSVKVDHKYHHHH